MYFSKFYLKCSGIYFLKFLFNFSDFLQVKKLLIINENWNNICYTYTSYRKYVGTTQLYGFVHVTNIGLVITIF